jgi:F-type H+-transporting ATPase subunit b
LKLLRKRFSFLPGTVILLLLVSGAGARVLSAQSSDSFISEKTATSQNLPAAEQEDETAVYKKSAVVQAVGRFFHLSPDAASATFEYFNFAILAGVILFYLAKLIPKAFRERQAKIDQQFVEAQTATEAANERLLIVEQRLGRLDQEIAELRKKSEQDGAADEQRIKQAIEEERRKIVVAAEQEIATASAVAERGLRKFAAELAMDRVMGRLHLTEQDDRTLVSSFAAGIEKTDLQERRN